MAQLRAFQMYEPTMFSGQINDVFFNEIAATQPQKIQKIAQALMATNMGTFTSWLQNLSTIKIEDHNEQYMWEIIGSDYINVPLVKAMVGNVLITSATNNVGAGGGKFQLYFPFRWFPGGGIIVGEKNEKYRIEIIGEPETDGINTVYNCKVTGENYNTGIPGEELVGGKLFTYEYYTVELENHGPNGTLNFATPAAIQNTLSMNRKDYSVYGREFNRKMYAPMPVKKGNETVTFTTSMPMVQWKFEQEFEEEFNKMIMYGRSNRDEAGTYHDTGKSGNVRREGAGFFEQKEIGHVIYYDTFTIELIEEALFQLSVNTIPMDQRVFFMRTGERGALQFSNAASA